MTRILLAILFAIFLVAPAQAGQWKSIATWNIEYGTTGCYTVDKYKDGMVFGFGLTKTGEFDLILYNQDWTLTAGERLALVKVDDADWSKHTATVISANTLLISLASEAESVRILQVGSALRLRLGDNQFSYALTGTKLMLPELIKCAAALRAYKST